MNVPANLISKSSAHWLTLVFASIYVGSLYVSKHARLSFTKNYTSSTQNGGPRQKDRDERWRDDPEVIRARLAAVSLASLICGIVVFVAISRSMLKGQEGKVTCSEPTYPGLLFIAPSISDLTRHVCDNTSIPGPAHTPYSHVDLPLPPDALAVYRTAVCFVSLSSPSRPTMVDSSSQSLALVHDLGRHPQLYCRELPFSTPYHSVSLVSIDSVSDTLP